MRRKIIITLAIITGVLLALGVGLNWWIDKKLPELITQKNDSPYHITYRNLDVSLWNRTIVADDIMLVPKESVDAKEQIPGFYADVKKITITGFGIFDVIFGSRISANNLSVDSPHLTILKDPNAKDQSTSDHVKPLDKLIRVSNLMVNNASISMRQIGRQSTILDVTNATVKLEGITVSDQTLRRKIPFTYKTYSLACDSVSYRPNAVYELRTKSINTARDGLKIDDFSFRPRISRAAYTRMLETEKDLYDLRAKTLALDKILWGYEDDLLHISIGTVFFDQLIAEIFRSKTVADDKTKKKLYSQQLREIGFPVEVGLLQLKNSRVTYEEEKDKEDGPGKLVFSQFNLKATGIASGHGEKSIPDVKIDINCRFMEVAPFDVKWSFNALDRTDGFKIAGHIRDFPSQALIPFTRPYVNAEFEGKLDDVKFDLTGNDNGSKGDFALEHSNFKVNILKKDGKRKNKIVSAIANIFVKKDSDEKPKKVQVSVEREKDKSFFNLLWRSVEDGLKETLL